MRGASVKVGKHGRHVVFIGMMGAGKTKVGRLVAEELGREFFDSDDVISTRSNRSVRDIFEQDGESTFRSIEAEVMFDLLNSTEPSVIAAGGGAVLNEGTQTLLAELGDVVWLRADVSVLLARLNRRRDHRPLLDGDDRTTRVIELLEERTPIYEAAANHIVDVDDRCVDETVQRVVEVLR